MRLSVSRRLAAAATVVAAAGTSLFTGAGVASAAPNIVVGPGSEINIVQRETARGIEVSACTLGVLAITPEGRRVGVTAGHCGRVGQEVAVPVPGRERTIATVGKIEKSTNPKTTKDGGVVDANEPDWGTVAFERGVNVVNRLGRVQPRSVGKAKIGDRVCRQGRTTGWQCGKVVDVAANRVLTDLKGDHGDSGGPLMRLSDGAALGITTSGLRVTEGSQEMSQFIDLGFVLRQAGGLRLAV